MNTLKSKHITIQNFKKVNLKLYIMKRLELIQVLDSVQYNIETVERQVNQKMEDTTYYQFFGRGSDEFDHDIEIRTKALAFWKRKFNRILNQLKY